VSPGDLSTHGADAALGKTNAAQLRMRFLTRDGRRPTSDNSTKCREQVNFWVLPRSAESFPQWFEFHERVWVGKARGGTAP
jgi:hypothetical protein